MKRFIFFVMVFGLLISACDNGNGTNGGEEFIASTNDAVSNDVATLGIIGTTATSSNTSVATVVSPPAQKIIVTSVAEGTAVITISDGTKSATINISISKTGSITIGTITKYSIVNEIAEIYRGTWYAGYDEELETGINPFEITSTSIIYEETTYSGVYTQGGGTISNNGVYTYFYQNSVKIGVAAVNDDGGQIFLGNFIGSESGSTADEINAGWVASPALDLSDLGTSSINLGGYKDTE
jgi:hypothetical protein